MSQERNQIGKRAQLYWPEESGWFEAVVTDYDATKGEHCLVYNFGTADEQYEWSNLANLSRDTDKFKWVDAPPLKIELPKAVAGTTGGEAPVTEDLARRITSAKDTKNLAKVQAAITQQRQGLNAQLAELSSDSESESFGREEGMRPPLGAGDES